LHRLHTQMIEELEKHGADPEKLWLVETQSYGEFSDHYGHEMLEDLTSCSPEGHQSIVYYHENGDVLTFATFDERNEPSFKDAAKEVAYFIS